MNSCMVPDNGWKSGYGYIHVQIPPILWHKHATTKSGGPIVQHSFAMNTHVCSIHFVIACLCQTGGGTLAIFIDSCMVLDKGWNSGYIH